MMMLLAIATLLLGGCSRRKIEIVDIVNSLKDKEVLFPRNAIFTSKCNDTVQVQLDSDYKIVTYIDSIGCTKCKMKLSYWKKFIQEIDSLNNTKVLFFIHSNKRDEMRLILRQESFDYPVCVDLLDSFNILNNFPNKVEFQTVLLNRYNRVVAIGNPINNQKIRELYMNIISGKNNVEKQPLLTDIAVSKSFMNFGEFSSDKTKKCNFTIRNIGENLLIVNNVDTSCGCVSISYSQEPIQPGGILDIIVTYKADHPEHFDKTITVYCNASDSPLQLKIAGNAK